MTEYLTSMFCMKKATQMQLLNRLLISATVIFLASCHEEDEDDNNEVKDKDAGRGEFIVEVIPEYELKEPAKSSPNQDQVFEIGGESHLLKVDGGVFYMFVEGRENTLNLDLVSEKENVSLVLWDNDFSKSRRSFGVIEPSNRAEVGKSHITATIDGETLRSESGAVSVEVNDEGKFVITIDASLRKQGNLVVLKGLVKEGGLLSCYYKIGENVYANDYDSSEYCKSRVELLRKSK